MKNALSVVSIHYAGYCCFSVHVQDSSAVFFQVVRLLTWIARAGFSSSCLGVRGRAPAAARTVELASGRKRPKATSKIIRALVFLVHSLLFFLSTAETVRCQIELMGGVREGVADGGV